MDFWGKIEAIRKKPESVRLRYVWFLTFLGVFFVLIIWIFSLRVNFSDVQFTQKGNSTDDLFNKIQASGKTFSQMQQELEKMKNLPINSSGDESSNQNQSVDNQ